MLKVELHTHSADDPVDRIPYSTRQLIEQAAALGYHALAVTLHDRQLDLEPFRPFAAERGITLIRGIERTIQGKHVLLLNYSAASESVMSFEDLAALRARERGLVIAPHAFFPAPTCLGRRLMDRWADLVDAVECNAMFTAQVNFNRAAERWARTRGKPMVGNGDVHRLRQLGTTFSMVQAEPDPEAICDAIRNGRVQVVARPLTWADAGAILFDMMGRSMFSPRWYRGHLPQASPGPEGVAPASGAHPRS